MAAKVAVHVGDTIKLKDKVKNLDLKMGIAEDLELEDSVRNRRYLREAEEIRKSRPQWRKIRAQCAVQYVR